MVKRLFAGGVRAAAVGLAGWVVILLLWQDRLMYFPREYGVGEVEEYVDGGGVILEFETAEGRQRAFFRAPRAGTDWIWVMFGGNAALALNAAEESRRWDDGAGWLYCDYPGFGGNAGRTTPASVRESALGAVAALARHLRCPQEQLVLRLGAVGQSLGSAAALMMADELGVRTVVLLAPFTTMTEMARLVVGWPSCLLNRHLYDNRMTLKSLCSKGARTWIIHGIDDEVVPISMARDLATVDPWLVKVTEVAGARHNDLVDEAGEEIVRVFQQARAR